MRKVPQKAQTAEIRWSFIFLRLVLLVFVSSVLLAGKALAEIPPTPEARQFLHDFASVLDEADRARIVELQEQVYDKVQVPLVVVTIRRMGDYDATARTIESFATKWFNTWGIGTQKKNDGILVIISTGDRKGRIELGESWARRFDKYCQRVMDDDMIPEFKKGNYSGGLVNAVGSLSVMAISGPDATPPGPSFVDKLRNNPFVIEASRENPIKQLYGITPIVLLVFLGLGCLIGAYFLPNNRKLLVIAGIVLISLALFFWIVLMFAAGLLLQKSGLPVGSDGGGGGFGGGSSGGGGASGSW